LGGPNTSKTVPGIWQKKPGGGHAISIKKKKKLIGGGVGGKPLREEHLEGRFKNPLKARRPEKEMLNHLSERRKIYVNWGEIW